MSRLQMAIDSINFARGYSSRMLEQTDKALWFRQPKEGVTHIAWQVGHLAMGQYRLCLDRTRGVRPEDSQIISDQFLKLFGKDSIPLADAAAYPGADEILAVYHRVHQQVIKEISTLTEAELDQPVLKPHAIVKTKLVSLMWCAQHEAIHTGQIGLLRRLLGCSPMW